MQILFDILRAFENPSQLRMDLSNAKIRYYGIVAKGKSESAGGWSLYRETKYAGINRLDLVLPTKNFLPSWDNRANYFVTPENNLDDLDTAAIASTSSPIYQTASYTKTVIATGLVIAATTVKIANANANRKAFSVYNNSTNSMYLGIESDVSGGNQIAQLGSNATVDGGIFFGGPAVWTGALYVRRNAGTGSVTLIEFT